MDFCETKKALGNLSPTDLAIMNLFRDNNQGKIVVSSNTKLDEAVRKFFLTLNKLKSAENNSKKRNELEILADCFEEAIKK